MRENINLITLLSVAFILLFVWNFVLFPPQIRSQELTFEKLLTYEKTVQLTSAQYQDFVGLEVEIPCCAFEKTQEDYSQNCPCGHHLALYGVGKLRLSQGYSKETTQKEINTWKEYFFPGYTESRGAC